MDKLILNKFKYILLDVDDTLLDFQKSQDDSIIKAYQHFNINITSDMLIKYKEINVLLWKQYENNEITTKEIFNTRFTKLNEIYNLNCDGIKIEELFRKNLDKSFYLIDNVLEFLNNIKDDYYLIVVTNGKKETQKSRLKLSGLDKYFKHIFISEEIGYKKPQIEFFKHIENNVKDFDKTKSIIIGDSLTSDIQGGINYGIKTCLFNYNNTKQNNKADYSITSFKEIVL